MGTFPRAAMTSEFAGSPASDKAADPRFEGLEVYLQPIIEVPTGAVWAFEALARCGGAPVFPLDEADGSGIAVEEGHALEAACIRAALERRPTLPGGARLALNVSPDGLLSAPVLDSWDDDLRGVVVEVTEHHLASDLDALLAEFLRLRERGAEFALDDVGTGYAGLLRLATTRPDLVKLDRTIVSGARDSEAQRSVLDALVTFSHRLGAAVVGEGVETLDDLTTLAEFDVDFAQGWAIGKPSPDIEMVDAEVIAACHRAREHVLQRRAPIAGAATRAHGMHTVVGALGSATGLASLHVATAQAAEQLGVDIIAASVLDAGGVLREITSSGAAIDTQTYAITDYPATRAVVEDGAAIEVHVNDPTSDPSERTLLSRMGHASLLMVPLVAGEDRIGVLEFVQNTHRRWTATDIADARGLAAHLGTALLRIGERSADDQ